jgi:hypothetical protein
MEILNLWVEEAGKIERKKNVDLCQCPFRSTVPARKLPQFHCIPSVLPESQIIRPRLHAPGSGQCPI